MDIKEYIKKYNLPFDKIKTDYALDFEALFQDEKEWLSNLEDKIHLLKNDKSEQSIREVIKKLKNNQAFDENDTSMLSVFVSKINTIVRIANRINNFKEGTVLANGNTLRLSDFFNKVALSNSLKACKVELNDNLNNFLPHIYSVIKHCQNPIDYPIYYKYWKNILREVLSKEDDYDSMCSYYAGFPKENRHLNFATYLGTIGIQIAKNISQSGLKLTKDSKEYKYLTLDVINIERYNSILDDSIGLTKQYFLVGAYWDGSSPADQSSRFIENGIWENGYDDKFTDEVNSVPVGSKIAIKAAFTREKTKSVMVIKARGTVLENNNDGKTLVVEWDENFIPFEVDFSGGYWATIKEVTNKDHINAIFHNTSNKTNTFDLVKGKFHSSIFSNYIHLLRRIISELKIQSNDQRIVYSVRDNRLNFTVGQRYCFNLYVSESKGVYGVISKTKLSDKSEPYDGTPPQPYYSYFKDFNPNSSEWESIIESIKDELSRTTKSGYRKYNNDDFENYVFSIVTDRKDLYNSLRAKMENVGFVFETEQKAHRQNREEHELKFIHPKLINKLEANGYSVNAKKFYIKPLSDETDCEVGFVTGKSSPLISENIFSQANTIDSYDNNPAWTNRNGDTALDNLLKSIYNYLNKTQNDMEFPLNTILYGPPGTGKTYNTILRSAEIVENRKIDSYDEALKIFKDNLHNRIEFITFHQNYSYEDFIQGLRPETDNKSSLTFDKKDGIFKKIAEKALENIKLSEKAPEELSNEALFDNALEKFKEVVEESDANYPINETAYIMEVEEDAFRYTGEKWTNHANGLRMKFSDLKEFYKNGVKSRKDVKHLSNISGLAGQHATYYFLVYEQIIKLLPKKIDAPLKVERKNYVIVIDEINRANISRVFGELITLIEPDKRSHGEIPLEAKLPSGDYFIVPSNLYIIGTMNTADKSIALLDIALRRRFEFESMYPLYEIKGSEIYDKDILLKINEQIIKSKGHDFQIGHAYFMGENKDLIQRMNKKVIPLLLEYFMNDEKEVKGILYNAGLQVEENSWPIKITGKRA